MVFDERTGQPMSVAGVMDEAQETFEDRYQDDPQNLHARDYYEEDLVFDDRTGQPLPKEAEIGEGRDLLDDVALEDTRDITHGDRDLLDDRHDLTHGEHDLVHDDKDLLHDDRNLIHDQRDLTHDDRDLTNENRAYPIDVDIDNPEARRAAEDVVEDRTPVSDGGVFINDKYVQDTARNPEFYVDREPGREELHHDEDRLRHDEEMRSSEDRINDDSILDDRDRNR